MRCDAAWPGMGINEVASAPSSLWQNPVRGAIDRLAARECLDHLIVLGEVQPISTRSTDRLVDGSPDTRQTGPCLHHSLD
jgi:hypothetical protein